METYQTSDLYLAGYLMMQGKKLIKIEKVGRIANFIFLDDGTLDLDNFYTGEDKRFLEYGRALRDLKNMMYNTLGTDKTYSIGKKEKDSLSSISFK